MLRNAKIKKKKKILRKSVRRRYENAFKGKTVLNLENRNSYKALAVKKITEIKVNTRFVLEKLLSMQKF